MPYCPNCGIRLNEIMLPLGVVGQGFCPTCGFVKLSDTPIQDKSLKIKYCKYCGRELPKGVNICSSCVKSEITKRV